MALGNVKMNVAPATLTFFHIFKYAILPVTTGPLHILPPLPQSVPPSLT